LTASAYCAHSPADMSIISLRLRCPSQEPDGVAVAEVAVTGRVVVTRTVALVTATTVGTADDATVVARTVAVLTAETDGAVDDPVGALLATVTADGATDADVVTAATVDGAEALDGVRAIVDTDEVVGAKEP
jgi:hypothetical protein